MSQLAIVGGTILTGDGEVPVIEDGYLLVDGSIIVEVGRGSPPQGRGGESIDAAGMLVSPGFVNAHTHLCMILGRTLGADRSLLRWLSETQLPLVKAFEPEDYVVSMQLGAIENLRAGNTTVCEVFFSPHYADGVDRLATTALDESGIRSTFFRCTNDEPFFEVFVETRREIVDRGAELIGRWRGSSRTQVGVGPLVPWTSSPESFRDLVQLAGEQDVGLHLHTAETPEYNDLVRARCGTSNVEMLADVGALGPRVMLNHCVFLSDRDIGLIAETGSHVIHDPTSNMILASGVARIPEMRAAGINVGLACDGPACNNGQDMIEAMKDAALLHKVTTRQPEILVAADVFEMATSGGARALGMGDRLGVLRPGYLADVVLIDTRAAHLTPIHDPMAALVYSARAADVHTVIVDGRIVVSDRKVLTLDEQEIQDRARQRARRARDRAGI